MHIESLDQMRRHLEAGGFLTLDGQGRLETQGAVARFFQKIGDAFRSLSASGRAAMAERDAAVSRAVDEIAKADVLLLLGTNLTSEVFGNYIKYFGGKYLIIIHKHSHYLDDTADMVFLDHPRNILPLLGYGEPEGN